MCLAVPMQVEKITDDGMAHCFVGKGQTELVASIALLDEEVKPGDYIIVHAGFAIKRMEPKDAEETLGLFHEMIEAIDLDNKKRSEEKDRA